MSSPQTAASTHVRAQRRARVEAMLWGLAILAITVVAAGLRVHDLAGKSFWTDEGVTAAFIRLDWYNFARILWRREANMTLYYLLLRGWSQLGDSVSWIRGLSVLSAVATIPALFALGRRLFGPGVGLTAAALLGVNAYHVRYAQEARSYSLVAFLTTLATYFFVRAVQTGRSREWTWYVVTSTLGIYAHFFAVLVVVAHWAALQSLRARSSDASGQMTPGAGFSPAALADFNRAAKRVGLWTLPIWLFVATTGAGPIRWLHRPGIRDFYFFLEEFAGNGGLSLLSLYLACGILAAIAAVRTWNLHRRSFRAWAYLLVLTWFAVPVVIALAFSLARPVFLPRYLIITLPALVLGVAAGLLSFRQRWMAAPAFALIVWLALSGVHSYYKLDFDILREDFRGVAAYVLPRAQPGDAILFYKGQGRFPYSYYAERFSGATARPTIVSPGHGDRPTWRDFMGKVTPQVLDSMTRDYGRVWLVLSQNVAQDGEDEITQQIRAAVGSRYRVLDVHDFSGIRVYLYAP